MLYTAFQNRVGLKTVPIYLILIFCLIHNSKNLIKIECNDLRQKRILHITVKKIEIANIPMDYVNTC